MKTFLNVFLDVAVCLSFILSTVALIAGIKKFPSRAEKIAIPEEEDPDREQKQRAAEKSLFRLEMKTAAPVLLCFAVSLISFFSGSCPKEFDEATILAVPVLICVIGVAFGGIFLGKYFLRVARKTGDLQKDGKRAGGFRIFTGAIWCGNVYHDVLFRDVSACYDHRFLSVRPARLRRKNRPGNKAKFIDRADRRGAARRIKRRGK